MAEQDLKEFQARLRHRLRHFLWDERNRKGARADALRRIMSRGWRSCLFGGVVRDVVVKSPWAEMRDIDIVVADVSIEDLHSAFSDAVVRQTRFGGLTLCIDGWYFDVWPLESTWGCRYFPLFASSFSVLPKTTFFSVEAIAVELQVDSGVPRTIYQERFAESVRKRTIFLNLPDNPYPELCIVRAFALARKLNFALGSDLVRHLARWSTKLTSSKLERAMVSHYGRSLFALDDLAMLVRQLQQHADSGTDGSLRIRMGEQLVLPFLPTEPVDSLVADATDLQYAMSVPDHLPALNSPYRL